MSWREDGGLRATVMAAAEVDAETRDAMYRVLVGSFEGHPREVFEADLDEKETAILCHRVEDGELVGFSTLSTWQDEHDGEPVAVLFSGDTILDKEAWGTQVLSRAWLHCAWEAAKRLDGPLYWFFICSGYRTYRFLPVFWSEFWPRHDVETPAKEGALLERLAVERFGEEARAGVVKVPGGWLREGVSDITDRRRRDPHIAFFEKVNPGHARGDELLCLCPLNTDNLTRAGWRIHRAVTT